MIVLFTVVIPTFNRSSYLERCIRSLFREIQGEPDIEVFVCDDGSSEDHQRENGRICSEVDAGYCHIHNRGQAVARNAGVRRSSGEWIVFLDDDVEVFQGWYAVLKKKVKSAPDDVVGLEGAVIPSGRGLWDREVQNLEGGLFLTCHIIYRRAVFDLVGGFDEDEIVRKAEDHHLAARVLKEGKVTFVPELKVVHLPRTVHLCRYFRGAFRRMDELLCAEESFFRKEPAAYGSFRYADTFWGTYSRLLFRHVISSLHRRGFRRLLSHPVQTFFLISTLLLEQLRAWMLLPGYMSRSTSARSNGKTGRC